MDMLLAIALILHGEPVKEYLPPRVEMARQVAKVRLKACGLKRGMSSGEVHDLLGPSTWSRCFTNSLSLFGGVDIWLPAGVLVSYGYDLPLAEEGKPDADHVDMVGQQPLVPILIRILAPRQ
jgi:hypothetical protein